MADDLFEDALKDELEDQPLQPKDPKDSKDTKNLKEVKDLKESLN